MIFNTWLFAFFAIIVFALYSRVRSIWMRNAFLMAAGVVFYVASVPIYILLVLALAVATWLCATLLVKTAPEQRTQRKLILIAWHHCERRRSGFLQVRKALRHDARSLSRRLRRRSCEPHCPARDLVFYVRVHPFSRRCLLRED